MCGIVAYTGTEEASTYLLNGLGRLEYRGYDSAGIALMHDGTLDVIKRRGKVSELKDACAALSLHGTCGIGHTRWATHGKPSEKNAHPHVSAHGSIALVHNGIIENYGELKDELAQHGITPVSQTDSELIAHLIELCYEQGEALRAETGSGSGGERETGSSDASSTCGNGANSGSADAHGLGSEEAPASDCTSDSTSDSAGASAHDASTSINKLVVAVHEASKKLIGSYALAVMCTHEPGTIVVTRHDSPLIVGIADDGMYAASDAIALLDKTRECVILPDRSLACLTVRQAHFYKEGSSRQPLTSVPQSSSHQPLASVPQSSPHQSAASASSHQPAAPAAPAPFPHPHLQEFVPEITHITWDIAGAEKGGYPDFMLKEIHEQPRVIRDTLAGRLVDGHLVIDELDLSPEELTLIDRVYVIACGTSLHAGLVAKQLIEGWARIPCEVEAASEFRYRNALITPTTLVVAVSQSGETADTLAAIRDARVRGARVFGITNVVGSPVAREADGVIYTKANKEIAVASTKSFLGQIVSLTLLALLLAQVKGNLRQNQIHLLYKQLASTAEQVECILQDTSRIQRAAQKCYKAASALFIGRGMGCVIAREGALKLKEISYLHAEAYPAGEMKHGPIALIEDGFPVIAVATHGPIYDKVMSNIQESKARGACVIALAEQGDEEIQKYADEVIYIPPVQDCFSAITASVPLQLLAREIALLKHCDVDQPRNLAKSVTVE